MRSHQDIDARTLAMHRVIAEKIRRDPALIERARLTLARWLSTVDPASRPYLDQWQHLLSQDLETCLAAVVEESPRATALRQSSPFAGLLTHAERFALLKSTRPDHEAR